MPEDRRTEFRSGAPAALGSYTYPRGTRAGTQLASDFITWLFAFDDLYCDANRIGSDPVEFSAVIGELIEVLEDPGRANSPELTVARALRDLDGRVAAMGSPVQRRRWADDTEKYLLAKLWEAGRRRAGSLPPLASYVHLRRLGGANVACLMLTDISLGREVPAEVMCSPPMTELVKAAADLADLDNDLLSFARESGPGEEFPINGVTAAALHGARDTTAAVDCVLRFRDARMRTLLELSARFAESPDSPAADYSRGVCDWVSGHIDWIMKSGRYSQLPLTAVTAEVIACSSAFMSSTWPSRQDSTISAMRPLITAAYSAVRPGWNAGCTSRR
ncbi:terpene synthase family protein [Nocardia tengchongensis]